MAKIGAKTTLKKAAHFEAQSVIAGYFEKSLHTRQSKHLRIRNAILDTIVAGHLGSGDRVPPEHELCAALSVSLGTVQRALRELSLDGTLVREHGRGTFIAPSGLPNDEVWQFRFRKFGDDKLLPVSTVVVSETVVRGAGRWRDALGDDSEGYLKIVRIITVAGGPECYNELYLRRSRFAALSDIALPQLRNINIKAILARQFNAPTLSITQLATAAAIPDAAVGYLRLTAGTIGMQVDVVGHSFGKESISLQRIWLPASDCYLDMTHEETFPFTAGGASTLDGRAAASRNADKG